MVVKNRVPELIAQKFGGGENVNLMEVQRQTGLNYSVVSRWYRDRVDRIDLPVLEVWCQYLNVGVGDILVYQPDEK